MDDYSKKSREELLEICKLKGIKGQSGKKKADILAALTTNQVVYEPAAAPRSPLRLPTAATAATVAAIAATTVGSVEVNKIIHGNCLDEMKKIPDNSIDMVCTDPPYFLDGLDGDWSKKSIDGKGSSSVVGNLPKGMKFDRAQSKKFHDFYATVSKEVFRVLKPGGAFLSFSSPRLYHSMAWAIESTGFEIRDMIGWVYTQSQVKAFSQDYIIDNDKKKTKEQKEALKTLCKDWKTPQLKPAIEPICLAVKPLEGRYIDTFEKYGTGLMNTSDETKTGEGYFPSNIVLSDSVSAEMDKVFLVAKPTKAEKGAYNTHLSVKPVNLISHLIKLFTKPGAVVLDPFMGSGTTAVAALHSKRCFLGYDLNSEYVTIAQRRVSEVTAPASP